MATRWATGRTAKQLVGPDEALTPEQLRGFYIKALGGRAAAPSIESCVSLAPMAGHGRSGFSRDGGELLSDGARAASVAFRNKLTEAESYWRTVFAGARQSSADDPMTTAVIREADRVEAKFAALRDALDDCADLLNPRPLPYKEKWELHGAIETLIRVFNMGIARTGTSKTFGVWADSPLVIFVHYGLNAFGWTIERGALLKHIERRPQNRDKSV